MKKIVFSLLFLISHLFLSHAVAQTIREQMSRIETAHKVSFVYDSALPLSSRYTGESLTGLSLEQSLERLFAHTPISYKVQHDGHVLLKAKKTVLEKTTRWTVSGHVRDAQGETLTCYLWKRSGLQFMGIPHPSILRSNMSIMNLHSVYLSLLNQK